MKEDQIALRIFNSVRKDVVKFDVDTQINVYQSLIDWIDRELGALESDNTAEYERFTHNNNEAEEDQDDGA